MSDTLNTLTWKEFLTGAEQFMEISRDLGDSWELYKKVNIIFATLVPF